MASPKKREHKKAFRFQRRVWKRDHGQCQYCRRNVLFRLHLPKHFRQNHNYWFYTKRGQQMAVLKASLHHVHEVSKGGKSHMRNLLLTCIECNANQSIELPLPFRQCRRCNEEKPRATFAGKHCAICTRWFLVEWWTMRYGVGRTPMSPAQLFRFHGDNHAENQARAHPLPSEGRVPDAPEDEGREGLTMWPPAA